jgi:hypothetical protein
VVGDLIGVGAAQERSVVGETPNLQRGFQPSRRRRGGDRAGNRRLLAADSTSMTSVPQHLKGCCRPHCSLAGARTRVLESRFEAMVLGTRP